MAQLTIQVTCVSTNSDVDGSEQITHLGGSGWRKVLSDIVFEIGSGVTEYFTVSNGEKAIVEVVRPKNLSPYLRTNKDNILKNNLLSLPRCPNHISS